jgi:hypothetical protein
VDAERGLECGGHPEQIRGIAGDNEVATSHGADDHRGVDDVRDSGSCTGHTDRPSTRFVELLDTAPS